MAEERFEMANEFAATAKEFNEFKEKMRDPVVIGAMLHKLSEERESSNLVLKQLNEKLDRLMALETRIAAMEQRLAAAPKERTGVMLPEIDEDIVGFVAKRGRACAEEVQAKFKYKGRNAASSRLNRLCDAGILEKAQVGRKVFFIAKSQESR